MANQSQTILAAISRFEKARPQEMIDCLRCRPDRGIAQEELENETCAGFCEDRKGVLAFYRELGDLYIKAATNHLEDSRKSHESAVQLYELYLDEFVKHPCRLARLTESELPRYVVVALGRALLGAGRGHEIVEKYEALTERNLEYAAGATTGLVLFDRSALQLWRQALEESSRAHWRVFCGLFESKDLLTGKGTKETYKEECAAQ